jgi:hypothetical protein
VPANRTQFDAATKRVIASAPPGLSREEFYNLVNQDLVRQGPSDDVRRAQLIRRPFSNPPNEGWDSPQPYKALSAQNPLLQAAANPKGLGDFLSLLLPGIAGKGVGTGISAATSPTAQRGMRAGWAGVKGALANMPIFGPMGRGAFNAASKAWNASGPQAKAIPRLAAEAGPKAIPVADIKALVAPGAAAEKSLIVTPAQWAQSLYKAKQAEAQTQALKPGARYRGMGHAKYGKGWKP